MKLCAPVSGEHVHLFMDTPICTIHKESERR